MSKNKGNQGFTLIELVIAVMMISVGVIALLQIAGASTVMLREGRVRTRATAVAASRLDSLRLVGASTSPSCTSLTGGSATHPSGVTETWTVTGTGRSRTVADMVTISKGRGLVGQMSFQSTIYCP